MIDFNNPYMTLQQKQHVLSVIAEGGKVSQHFSSSSQMSAPSFSSYWILSMRDLWHLNKMGTKKLSTKFVLNQQKIEKYFPDFSVILLGADRIEKGEWDNFERKWAGIGYQHTMVLGCNGVALSLTDQGCLFARYSIDPGSVSSFRYPSTLDLMKNGEDLFSIGLLDIPLDDLVPYQDKQFHERLTNLGDLYTSTIQSVLKHIGATSKKSNGFGRKSTKYQSFN